MTVHSTDSTSSDVLSKGALSMAGRLSALRAAGKIGLIPFIPAGYPNLAAIPALLRALDSAGASVIEIGFPFSDPVADGPTIQAAFTEALASKVKVSDIFAAVKSVSDEISAPMVPMVSYSIVYRYGTKRFFDEARLAGFSGLIIPDLPPEAQRVCDEIRSANLDTILLVAPTTTPQRRKEIARLCSGFVYYLSVSGITGQRDALPVDLANGVAGLCALTDKPVCVGFGISQPSQVKELAGVADAAIVGSAIVKRMKETTGQGVEAMADAVKTYCQSLLSVNS